jgi:hypothetical protein
MRSFTLYSLLLPFIGWSWAVNAQENVLFLGSDTPNCTITFITNPGPQPPDKVWEAYCPDAQVTIVDLANWPAPGLDDTRLS